MHLSPAHLKRENNSSLSIDFVLSEGTWIQQETLSDLICSQVCMCMCAGVASEKQ